MFYLLMAAIVAVVVFVLGYVLGKNSSTDGSKSLKDENLQLKGEVMRVNDAFDIQRSALRIISNGSANPSLEAEIALSDASKILFNQKEITK